MKSVASEGLVPVSGWGRSHVVLAREGGALPLMALPFRFGLGGRLGNGRQWFPWIHVDDLVALLRAVAGDPGYRGPVNAVAPEPIRNRGERVGRNDPCPCNSGKKYKNCCMRKTGVA